MLTNRGKASTSRRAGTVKAWLTAHTYIQRLAAALIAAALAMTAVACESENATSDLSLGVSEPTQTAPLGSTLQIRYETDWRYGTLSKGVAAFTVANLRIRDVPVHRFTGDGTFFTVQVTVRVDSGTVRVNPYFFSARTRDGVNLLADVTSLEDGLLEGQHYREGAQVSGLLGFDVPRGKVLQEIALNAGNLGRTLGRWTVP